MISTLELPYELIEMKVAKHIDDFYDNKKQFAEVNNLSPSNVYDAFNKKSDVQIAQGMLDACGFREEFEGKPHKLVKKMKPIFVWEEV